MQVLQVLSRRIGAWSCQSDDNSLST